MLGKDIKRYSYEWADKWVILAKFDSHKYLEKDYPQIYSHLLLYKDKLQARGQCKYARGKENTSKGYPGQHHWLELDNNPKDSYMNDFARQKIVYSEIVREPQFYLDNGDFKFGNFFAEATSFILTGEKINYLLGILNSKITGVIFKNFYAGGGLGESGYRYKKAFIEKLPIPKVDEKKEASFVILVNEIIECKKENKPIKELEEKLDLMVFELYNLNETEIKSVLSLSLNSNTTY